MDFVEPIRDKKHIEAMKKILKSDNLRNFVLFVVGINSGLRINDLRQLEDTDVKKPSGKFKERIILRESKTNKLKNYPINDSAKKALQEYLGNSPPTGTPLFPSRKGDKPISRVQAYRILNSAARLIGIQDHIGTHSLRKTFGYHAFKRGYPIALLMELFNHSSEKMTLKYIGITQDDIDNVYINVNL
ncbi:site-specific integrase [Dehalobacter sp. TeCB1]|uniref:site-specific integrase n=1 Tax=Dehalobacter sp. TeCB1 TaxID=1843715 RepID=UPI00083A0B3E|nr:site-specific integrase [Dehalobacter sp. TeCB1]OCZ50850.1 integrase [Dehalobacter sp. TeCB1]